MGKSIGLGAVALLALGSWLAGCSGSSNKSNPGGDSCSAGVRRCSGATVMECSADGSAERAAETCDAPRACAEGQCVETLCVPNTKFCADGSVWKCDSTGGGKALSQACSAAQFCLMDDDDAECSDAACVASTATCDGDIATTCKVDGSGPAPGGTDCAKSKQVCYLGQCRDQACLPGEKVCQQGDLYLCANSGTATSLLVDCQATEVCDGKMGDCRPRVCEPGKLDCDSTRVVKCNEFGSGWEQSGTDCAGDGQICAAGACLKQTCSPNGTFCKDSNVYQCNGTGVSSSLYQTCTPGYSHCRDYGDNYYATCEYNQCTPGELLCDNNQVKTCTADATYPPTGKACGSQNYCENGECKPRVCTPYEYTCKNGDIYYCDDYGGASSLAQSCVDETACQLQAGGGAVCVRLPCEPSTTACVGNKIGTCATDGSSISTVTTDCAAAGNVCTMGDVCAKVAVDEIGVETELETQGSGYAIGDVIDVTSARKLTKLEAYLTLVAARDLRWAVFEQVGNTFVARVDSVVASQKGSDFFSSGAMSYTLKAGKRYLFAVAVTGGSFGAVYDYAPWSPQGISFGNALGGLPFYYQPTVDGYFPNDRIYQMRLTTELP